MELQQLFSVQTLFLSLGTGVILQVLKGWLEIKWPNLPSNKNWNHAYLPTISLMIGMLLSFFSGLIPSFLISGTLSDHLINGCVAGFFSSYIFRGINAMLSRELQIPPSTYPDVDNIPGPPKLPNFPPNKDSK